MTVMRIALGIEYLGTAFSGWQSQKHDVRTVQECVEKALSKVANHPVRVVCAGRTDAGVHATGQVVHFETQAQRRMRSWILGGTANLPRDIGIAWARMVTDDFHARFTARSRRYRYVIANRDSRSGLLNRRVSWVYRQLDAGRMHVAAQYLVGENDFSTFRAQGCQARTPMRNVHWVDVTRRDGYVCIEIQANAFLHHMVRNIAGVLIEIGMGDREPEWVQQLMQLRDRSQGGVTASADGLYLVGVNYPDEYQIPSLANAPLFL